MKLFLHYFLYVASIRESLESLNSLERPSTTANVARRMIGHALGVKINVTPEQREKEREELKLAKGINRIYEVLVCLRYSNVFSIALRKETKKTTCKVKLSTLSVNRFLILFMFMIINKNMFIKRYLIIIITNKIHLHYIGAFFLFSFLRFSFPSF